MARKQKLSKKHRVSDEAIYNRILEMCGEAGSEKSVKPEAVAQNISEFAWQALIKRTRRAAVQLANAGYIHIMRKGKVADPNDFKGLYKVRLVEGANWKSHLEDETVNKGSGLGAGKAPEKEEEDDDSDVEINVRQ